ncbi:MAG TPA: hypothetical protein VH352_06690, partial [Pseudonocardiaceae bacterium]|nr:hypothetical protein [Pseudonocardiaceae bacterium]
NSVGALGHDDARLSIQHGLLRRDDLDVRMSTLVKLAAIIAAVVIVIQIGRSISGVRASHADSTGPA